jgi:hypothetical protein
MAKVTSAPADLSGKIGETIFYEVNGEKLARKAPGKKSEKQKKKNPPTELQLFHQQRMSLASGFLYPIQEVLEFSYQHFRKGTKKGIHQATSNLMTKALYFSEQEELLVDPSLVLISQGNLTGFEQPAIFWNEQGNITLKWEDNTGIRDARATDQAFILLYHLGHQQSFYNLKGNFRSQQQQEIPAPLPYKGSLHAYIAFSRFNKRTKKFDISDSQYLGVI